MSHDDRPHHPSRQQGRSWSIAIWIAVVAGAYWYLFSSGPRHANRSMAARRIVDQTRPMRPDGTTVVRYPPIDGPIVNTDGDFDPIPKNLRPPTPRHNTLSIRSLAPKLPPGSWVLFQINVSRLKAIPCVGNIWPILKKKLVDPALSHFGIDETKAVEVEAAMAGHDLQDWDSFPLWRMVTRYRRVFGPKTVILAKTRQSLLSILKRYALRGTIAQVSIHGVLIYRRDDGTSLALLGPGLVLAAYQTPIAPYITGKTMAMSHQSEPFLAELRSGAGSNQTIFKIGLHTQQKTVTLKARLSGGNRFSTWRRHVNQCLKELRDSLWARKAGLHFFLNRGKIVASSHHMTITVPMDPTCSRLQAYVKKAGR
ncbi:MAG: hypothetical protein J7M25_16415 [Deltaproteobacteria bacterium]|nr:hypothetical protein [Deltaproteobacteria bacterium]